MNRTTSLSAFQRPLRRWLLGLALVCAGFAASAQQVPIARLNLQQGTVSVSSAGDDRWSAARPGRQLAVGDRIWTDRNARAEVYIGPAALRLDGGTSVEFSGIDEDTVRIDAGRGNLQLSVRDMASGQRISIVTPNASVAIGAPGEYRIAIDEADTTTTWAAVASGHLTLHGQNGISQLLTARQQTTVSGRNLTTVRTTRSQNSSFDTWVAERGRFEGQPGSARYAQPAVVVPPAALIARQQQIEYEQAQQQEQWMQQQRAAQAAQQQMDWQREQDWRQQEEWRRQEDWRQQREWQQRRDWRQRAEQDRWQQQQQQQQLQLQLQQQQQQALRQQQEMQQRAAQAQAMQQQQQLLQQQQAQQMRAAQQQAQAQQQMLRQQQEMQQRAAQMQQQAQAQQQALQQAQLRALQQQRGIPPQPNQPAGDDPRRLWTSPDSRQ